MEKIQKDATVDDAKPNYRGVKAMPYIIGNESFEKLGTIGTTTNLLVYLTTVFNLSSITSTNIVNIFNGSANFATLIGAFLADTYFGRYAALGFSSVASFLGMLVLTLTAAITELHPPHCAPGTNCDGPTTGQFIFLLGGFALLVVGAGGIRPCNLAFGADQFNPETALGKRGITSFFNWYYFTFTFAMMISVTFIVYVQANINWAIGLAIPAFLMFLSTSVFFIGTKIYVVVKPEGSPLVSVVQVIAAAVKKRNLKESGLAMFDYVPSKSINSRLPCTDQFRFLNKAAIKTEQDQINADGSAANPWQLSSLQQVEQVKCIMRIIPIWISGIMYYIIVVIMQQNYVVFQALQMDRYITSMQNGFQIPAASTIIFSMLVITIWLPFYDRLIVPKLRKQTGKEGGITVLQKIGIGMAISVITMIVSGVIEEKRRVLALRSGQFISPMSWAWLVPQLVVAGLSEAFTMVGLVEFYYKQVPENMRSMGGAFLFCGLAISSYLGSFLVSIIHRVTARAATGNWLAEDLNKGRLDYVYYLVAALELVNFVYFLACARWYRYKESCGNPDVGAEGKLAEKLGV
ncbi:NRT1/ PTR FAMILY 2.11-like protein [Drosera capensis]